ncbi:MAG: PIN domain-containing protein [Candidatus Dormibacteraeota bacterium]|nr:PIN domain-containing protein [Candidatus Dormibacteraeota bacterium]
MNVVLDADVVIGALEGSDRHHLQSRSLFRRLRQQGTPRLISAVNLSEVLVAPAADRERLRRAREAIAAFGVAVHQPNEAIAVEAARLRGRYPISLPDGYCVATAKQIDASVVSFDAKVIRAARGERIATSGLGRTRP